MVNHIASVQSLHCACGFVLHPSAHNAVANRKRVAFQLAVLLYPVTLPAKDAATEGAIAASQDSRKLSLK